MLRNLISLFLWLSASVAVAVEGRLNESMEISSKHLGTNRKIRIYLPPSYESQPARRFPVIYVHDGQNVFTSAGTNIAFGWGNWELDKTADRLFREGKMQEVIMVAVDNSSARYEEYCGRIHSGTNATPTSFEHYADFLIRELKPRIDKEYRTKPDAANTGLLGSSLGGICSLVLAWENPEVFGKAASLSGSFQVERTNFLNLVLGGYQGKAKPIRIYLDSGSIDFTGGDDGRALTERVNSELKRIGWKDELTHYIDEKPLTVAELEVSGLRRDKWSEAQTSQHNEFYWRLRAWRALIFLFPAGKDAK